MRDWLYVEDHADALLAVVLTQGAVGRSYNIGGENEARNIDLVHDALRDPRRAAARQPAAMPSRSPIVADRPGHDLRYAIDPTRIRDRTGLAAVGDAARGAGADGATGIWPTRTGGGRCRTATASARGWEPTG